MWYLKGNLPIEVYDFDNTPSKFNDSDNGDVWVDKPTSKGNNSFFYFLKHRENSIIFDFRDHYLFGSDTNNLPILYYWKWIINNCVNENKETAI